MKKILCTLIAITMVLSIVGCSANEESPQQETPPESQAEQDDAEQPPEEESTEEAGITVDEGLLNVELTLPASFLGDDFTGELDDEDRANGFKSVVVNDDGSATYTISKSAYSKFMKEFEDQIREYLNEIPGDYETISEVTLNSNMTEATLIVDKAA